MKCVDSKNENPVPCTNGLGATSVFYTGLETFPIVVYLKPLKPKEKLALSSVMQDLAHIHANVYRYGAICDILLMWNPKAGLWRCFPQQLVLSTSYNTYCHKIRGIQEPAVSFVCILKATLYIVLNRSMTHLYFYKYFLHSANLRQLYVICQWNVFSSITRHVEYFGFHSTVKRKLINKWRKEEKWPLPLTTSPKCVLTLHIILNSMYKSNNPLFIPVFQN